MFRGMLKALLNSLASMNFERVKCYRRYSATTLAEEFLSEMSQFLY